MEVGWEREDELQIFSWPSRPWILIIMQAAKISLDSSLSNRKCVGCAEALEGPLR